MHAGSANYVRSARYVRVRFTSACPSPATPGGRGDSSLKGEATRRDPQSAAPAAPPSRGHAAFAGPRRPRAGFLAARNARLSTQYVADATVSAAPPSGVRLRTTTSSVKEDARAAMRLCSPFGQPAAAKTDGYHIRTHWAATGAPAKRRLPPADSHPAGHPLRAALADTLVQSMFKRMYKPSHHFYQHTALSRQPGGKPHCAKVLQRPRRPRREKWAITMSNGPAKNARAKPRQHGIEAAVAETGPYHEPSER